MYIFPMQETQEAITDHINDPEDTRKLLHVEAMLTELLNNVRKEVLRHGLLRENEGSNPGS